MLVHKILPLIKAHRHRYGVSGSISGKSKLGTLKRKDVFFTWREGQRQRLITHLLGDAPRNPCHLSPHCHVWPLGCHLVLKPAAPDDHAGHPPPGREGEVAGVRCLGPFYYQKEGSPRNYPHKSPEVSLGSCSSLMPPPPPTTGRVGSCIGPADQSVLRSQDYWTLNGKFCWNVQVSLN